MNETVTTHTLGHGDRPETRRLILRGQQGDQRALGALLEKNRAIALRLATKMIRDPELGLEIVQQANVKAIMSIATFDGRFQFSTWYFKIVLNEALNLLRRRRGVTQVEITGALMETLPLLDIGPEFTRLTREMREHLEKAFNAVPVHYRTMLILNQIELYSYEEICEITGLPLGTVKSRIHRGRLGVREYLQRHCPHLLRFFGITKS